LKELDIKRPSIARSSVASELQELDNQIADETMNIIRREPVVAGTKDKAFKVRTYAKNATQLKRKLDNGLLDTIPEETRDLALAQTIGKDLILQDLIAKETLLLAVSSATYQGLTA